MRPSRAAYRLSFGSPPAPENGLVAISSDDGFTFTITPTGTLPGAWSIQVSNDYGLTWTQENSNDEAELDYGMQSPLSFYRVQGINLSTGAVESTSNSIQRSGIDTAPQIYQAFESTINFNWPGGPSVAFDVQESDDGGTTWTDDGLQPWGGNTNTEYFGGTLYTVTLCDADGTPRSLTSVPFDPAIGLGDNAPAKKA